MLIVLEGLDGAGKSTQVKRLKEYLTERCGSLEYIHFPRYDAPVYGDLISRFLRGDFGSNEAVHPQLVALLFAEDRHGAAPVMRQAWAEGKTVLLTVVSRHEAVLLRTFIRKNDPSAFLIITSSTEIIGNGFRGVN